MEINKKLFKKQIKICGVVVWYNPKEEYLKNIETYLSILDELYIIDNSNSNNKNMIKNLKKIEYVSLGVNKGIAYALNLGLEKAFQKGYDYLLTMDQDSSFLNNSFREYVNFVMNDKEKNVALYSPIHVVDEKIMNEVILENKVDIKYSDRENTSGNILNLKYIKNIGKFNEDFFIDEVDIDFCYRIIKEGYKIKKLNFIPLKHFLGNFKRYKIGGKVTHHNYIRRYYITRNKLYMRELYKEKVSKKYKRDIWKDIRKIIFFEKDKILKLKMCWRAYKDFRNGVKGPLLEKYIVKKEK